MGRHPKTSDLLQAECAQPQRIRGFRREIKRDEKREGYNARMLKALFCALMAAGPPDAALTPVLARESSLTRDDVLQRVRSILSEGFEVDRLRGALNLLLRKALQRYPRLRPLLAAARIPENLQTPEEFSAEILHWMEKILPRLFEASALEREQLLALAARWLENGRVPLDEAVFWALTSGDGWRRLRSPGDRDLALLRERIVRLTKRRLAKHGGGRTGAETSPEPAELPALAIEPILVRTLAIFVEDFLSHYEEGACPVPAATGEEYAGILAKGALPPSKHDTQPYAAVRPDPRVMRGIERLFADLTREALGLDPCETARLVGVLPDGGWSLAAGGYFVRAGEPFLLPLHRVAADYLQLARGSKIKIEWLRERADLERILLDPAAKRIILAGHASIDGYAFEGFTGPPEETLARLLAWIRDHAGDLAPRLRQVVEEGDFELEPLRSFLDRELDTGWRRWSYADFQAIASRPGFVPKERLIVYACSVGEVEVEVEVAALAAELRMALLAELRASEDAGQWLEFSQHGRTFTFSPLRPAADRRFREAFPALLGAVGRRMNGSGPVHVEARRDFSRLLARETGRFPGISSALDFLSKPDGTAWEPEDVVRDVKREMAGAR